MNHYRLLALIFCTLSSVHTTVASKKLDTYSQELQQAYDALQPELDNITATRHRTYGGPHGSGHVYRYSYASPQARIVHELYTEVEIRLFGLLSTYAIGSGVCIGTLLAVTNKLLSSSINNKKTLCAALLLPIAAVIYQARSLKPVTYFSESLQKSNLVNWGTVCGFSLLALLATCASYYGTHAAITTLTDK